MGLRRPIRQWLKSLRPEKYAQKAFIKELGYVPDFVNPVTFNEKIHHRKLYGGSDLMRQCADKAAVREFVRQRIGEQFLIPLVGEGLYSTPSVQQLKALGNNVVVKATHDSGSVFIIRDTHNAPYETIEKKLKKCLKRDWGKHSLESWYSGIPPQLIAERLMLTSSGNLPEDYKFHVFERPDAPAFVILQVDFDRATNHTRAFYGEALEQLPLEIKYPSKTVDIRNQLRNAPEMFALARKLGEGFGYSRVDLYNIDGDIRFGEMTFGHGSGLEKFEPLSGDRQWGEHWQVMKD